MALKKIDSFTGLRFVMIMVIVLSHFEFPGNFGKFYEICFSNAVFAVDFFFLLSGFGMMYSNVHKIQSLDLKRPSCMECFKYGINHIKKLYPVYLATILIPLVYTAIVSLVYDTSDFSLRHESVKLLVNLVLLQSLTGMTFFTHAFNGVSWFLSSLFCIYLVSPLLIYFLRKKSKSYFIDFIFCAVCIFSLWILARPLEYIEMRFSDIDGLPSFGILAYGSPYRRIFYVTLGMEIALIYNKLILENKCISSKSLNFYEIVSVMIAVIYSLIRRFLISVDLYLILDGIFVSIFIFVFAFDGGVISKLLKKKLMQTLGNLSMYIFLIHFPLIIYFLPKIKNAFNDSLVSIIFGNILVLILTFVISWLVYRKSTKNMKTVDSTT